MFGIRCEFFHASLAIPWTAGVANILESQTREAECNHNISRKIQTNLIYCVFVTVRTHPVFCLDVSHKLCDGTNQMIVFERRRNQMALKLNDAALALIGGAKRRSPSKNCSLGGIGNAQRRIAHQSCGRVTIGYHFRKPFAADYRLNRRYQTSRR